MRARGLILAAVLAAAPSVAQADEPIPQKARRLADYGRSLHDRGEFGKAVVAFKEAYVIAPSPGLLFNIAQAYRLQGNCDDAAIMYRRYLNTQPHRDARTIAEGHLRTVERCVQKRALNIPLDESMAYLRVPPPPGPEHILPSTSTDTSVVVRKDAQGSSNLKKDIGAGVAMGGTVAVGLAVFYGLRAHSSSEEVERLYAQGAKWEQVADVHARGQTSARNAKIFGVGGGLAIAGGVTLFLLGRRAERLAPLTVTPAAKGAEVSYAWRF